MLFAKLKNKRNYIAVGGTAAVDFPSAIAIQKAKTAITIPVTIMRVLCKDGLKPKKGINIIQRPKTPLTQFCHINLCKF